MGSKREMREVNLRSDIFWSVAFGRMKRANERWVLIVDDDGPMLTGKGIVSAEDADGILIDRLSCELDDEDEGSEVR